MLGDGGMTLGQLSVTISALVDQEYAPYIVQLIKSLFKVNVSVVFPKNHNVIKIRVSSVNLVKFLSGIGLVIGNKVKQNFNFPKWIQKDESYIKSCIRGIIDTDGCVNKKVRREKTAIEYRSIGIYFKSASPPLLNTLVRFFNLLGFKVSISGRSLYLCGEEQVKRYVKEVGFSNPKHWVRYYSFLPEHGWKKFDPKNCFEASSQV